MYTFFEKRIPRTERNKMKIEVIEKEAERLLSEPIQSLSFSKYKLFHETGNRLEYEGQYMERRKRLNLMAAMELWEHDKKWVEALEDVLWAICDESTWGFPAHIKKDATPYESATIMDLFAAETAMTLSEICYLLEEQLHPTVYQRVIYELRRRIIEPHLKDVYTYRSNWSAVCACGVGFAVMYHGTKEEFEQARESLLASLSDFLDSYTEDGCCLEGPIYWSYGFSHFVFLAQLLREYTKGEINLFADEKVKNIALYVQRTVLKDDYVVPFGDTSHRYRYEYCLMNFLSREYKEVIRPEDKFLALHEYSEKRDRFARFIRDFFWTEEAFSLDLQQSGGEMSEGQASVRTHAFRDSQQYFRKFGNYVFAAKGGFNSEPHNHNDIGSFILFSDGKYLLDDLGWAEYDNLYFTARRYENLCASSRGHSVPIINGEEQKPGGKIRAIASYEENQFSLDMTLAYSVEKVRRTFRFENDRHIILEDSYEGETLQITERLVTRERPTICGDDVVIGPLTIRSQGACDIQIEERTYQPRALGDLKETETAYLIDFIYPERKGCAKMMLELLLD